MWLFNTFTNRWSPIVLPVPIPARSHHAAVRIAEGTVLFFGGHDGHTHFGDTFLFASAAHGQYFASLVAQPPFPSPPARRGHTLVHEPTSSTVWLYGGSNETHTFDDLWRFDCSEKNSFFLSLPALLRPSNLLHPHLFVI